MQSCCHLAWQKNRCAFTNWAGVTLKQGQLALRRYAATPLHHCCNLLLFFVVVQPRFCLLSEGDLSLLSFLCSSQCVAGKEENEGVEEKVKDMGSCELVSVSQWNLSFTSHSTFSTDLCPISIHPSLNVLHVCVCFTQRRGEPGSSRCACVCVRANACIW